MGTPPGRDFLAYFNMPDALADPFYYLKNFQTVLTWVGSRYSDLLAPHEHAFIEQFAALPQASRALLVRLIMRRGELFRASRLQYPEIGDPHPAAGPLLEQGWIDDQPLLTLEQLFGLLTKAELARIFPSLPKSAVKSAQLESLRADHRAALPLAAWAAHGSERVYQLRITELCERLRLMFFGNAYQDWTEFVLSDLGLLRYEKVDLPASARAFQRRADVDDYLHLLTLRLRFEQGEPAVGLLPLLPPQAYANDWIQFWPQQRRYRMIEVKGPGDRLQDSQLRLLAHFSLHAVPVAVCHVRWAEPGA